jgi:hypothetical protein
VETAAVRTKTQNSLIVPASFIGRPLGIFFRVLLIGALAMALIVPKMRKGKATAIPGIVGLFGKGND